MTLTLLGWSLAGKSLTKNPLAQRSLVDIMLAGKKQGVKLFSVMALAFAVTAFMGSNAAYAQETEKAAAATESADAAPADAAQATDETAADGTASADAAVAENAQYTPMKPTPGKGQPIEAGVDFQTQYSDLGEEAYFLHNAILLPIITVISLFVLALLLWVIVRYRRKANPEPSRVAHNTLIEIIWILIPVLILLVVAIPSINLLVKQYETAPEGALTVKVTGYQWYWGYGYPDNGGFEVVSNMLSDEEAIKRGEPTHLAADNRMVVPAGEPIRLQITAADVIHSFAVPSLWFKMDAVPGRLNEKMMIIKEPGVYYGQCSELCGVKHGYMPIAIEALPRDKFEAWVRAQGGEVGGEAVAEAEAEAPKAEDADANKTEAKEKEAA